MPQIKERDKHINFNNNKFLIGAYCDSSALGNSRIKKFKADSNEISLSWVTQKGFPHPFAGLSILPRDGNMFSLCNYDHFEITFNEELKTPIFLYIHYNIKGYTIKNDPTTTFLKRELILTSPKNSTVTIPLVRMKTPHWWFVQNPDIKNFTPNKNEVISLSIEDGDSDNFNKNKNIRIASIKACKNKVYLYIKILIFIIFIPLAFSIKEAYTIIKKRLLPEDIFYVKNRIESREKEYKEYIVDYINQHYSDPNLTKKKAVKDLKISHQNISFLLKSSLNTSFRDYLNNIRLEKTTELLKNPDYSITEIAFEVGFKLPSSFNRIFKKKFGISPREFRKTLRFET